MDASWITGVCARRNRLEWTVLRRVKDAWEIFGHGAAETPPAAGGAGWISGADLKPHLKHFKGKIAVALATDRALLRVALLPSTEAEELRGMAELQTDKFSPFPVETVAAGTEVLAAAGNSSLVAMAVVRREDVEAVGQAFQDVGALPDAVDVAALGWWWTLKRAGQVPAHGSQIFMRAAAGSLDLAVARDGSPLLFRSLPVAPAAEAGAAAELDDWTAGCAEEVADSLTALETEWGGTGAPTLHVFHDETLPAGQAEALRQALGLETFFAHPLAELPPVSEGVARRLADPARPLAMDLAPDSWRAADAARRSRRHLLRSATVFFAVWLLGIGVFWTLLNVQRGRLTRLQAEVEDMEGPAMEVRRLRAKSLEFALFADRSASALECLRTVSEVLPPGMDLTSFAYRKGATLALRGEAETPDKVYGFIQALEQTERFPEVKFEGVSTRNTPQGARSQFGVTIRLPGGGEEQP